MRARGQAFAAAGDPEVTGSTDGDAFLEPGETGTVRVPVTNQGDVAARRVRARLRTSEAGVLISPARRGYGRVAAGRTERRTFRVTVPAELPLGTRVGLRTTVRFRGVFSPQRATTDLVVGQPATSPVTVSYDGPPVPIPDDSSAGASVPLAVTGVGPVSRVTFSIDGTECSSERDSTTVGLDHTFVGDLVGTLTSPDGTTVTLFERTADDGVNLCRTVFADDADRSIQVAGPEDAPFTGSWQPAEPLSALVGGPGDGTWTFRVEDLAGEDIGAIRAVSVNAYGFVGTGARPRR